MMHFVMSEHLICRLKHPATLQDIVYLRDKHQRNGIGIKLGLLFHGPKWPIPLELLVQWDEIAELVFSERCPSRKRRGK